MESLSAARVKHEFAVWAYVLMPEHVHLLILPGHPDYSISDILADIKQPVTRRALRYCRQNAPTFLRRMMDVRTDGTTVNRFWQRGGGYDRNLIKPSAVHETVDYIHANPVRRGLVESPGAWGWSSAGYYEGRSDVTFVPDDDCMPPRDG